MSTPSLPEEQLLELLTQLQKTTPEQARAILNSQPQITYALMPLMIKMELVNLEVLQKTLATYVAPAAPVSVPAPVAPVAPAVPAHLMQSQPHPHYHTTPPPAHQPHVQTVPNHGTPLPNQYAVPPPHAAPYPNGGYPVPPQPQPQRYAQPAPSVQPPSFADALGNVPEEQREMIVRVISMTPEQVNRLPPQERAITIQLRATLGLPTE